MGTSTKTPSTSEIKFKVNFDIDPPDSYSTLPLKITPELGLTRKASSQEEYVTINKYLPDVQKTVNETFTVWYESEQTQGLLDDRGVWTSEEPTEWGSMVTTDKMGWTSAARSRIEEQVIPRLQSSIPEVSGGMGCKFTFEHNTDIRVPFKYGDGIPAWLQSLKCGTSDPHKECAKPYEYIYREDGGEWTRA
ncbi:hypothetical protein I204_07999 [Kwoniella mangroviensis CBS 8886]|uniref:uncharacterized protein n=1 Tax=Kwoniella mangroviensis CBS 8507 TaxID=1296122 RepID=UPI00080CD5FA|nr:uncharacterized protein I203_01639 [Kwoniella mangroviensis CBS 8507]OCF69775.1 hypothetical protein I203_01639 [Kwoniella mangroviensis CBS 8507]OCF71372.1 hypothetical protein I204_07999 [Kwoniella mangroviensis CBS 8886]